MPKKAPNPTPVFCLAVLALTTGCKKLDDPVLPLTGTSSTADVVDGSSIGSPSTPTPPPPPSNIPPVNGITAPTIADPLPGSETPDSTPRLTVRNATSETGGGLVYDFQVARDDGFTNVVAQAEGIPKGPDTTTSWEASPPLGSGRHFWRARARGASGPGPYSAVSDVTITSGGSGAPGPGPGPAPPTGSADIFDPLTNGGSVGEVGGGRFTSAGWQVTHRGNFIRYRVPTISSGFVEWENLNLTRNNPQRDLFSLMGMWDPTRGDYRENPFRVHIRKVDRNGHIPPTVRLRFISNGDQHDVGWDFLDWNPSHPYQWRLEWGPHGSGNEARVFLDGRLVIRTGYGPRYSPKQHWVELGIEERAESIIGVIYRNVRIGRR